MFEWLIREGGLFLSWWLLVTLAGLAAWPLLMRLLGGLPDRGYTLARTAGLLLVAFVYWLLAILGFLRNTTGGMLLAWLIVLGIGVAAYLRGPRIDWRAWWRSNRGIVIAAEIVFFSLFLLWTAVRAHQNGLLATEKPMELAFISATMRSGTFPPNDPWMAGYAISYYYFGYVITAMLALLSGVASTVAFNLMIALLFALTGLTAFGVVANLVRAASSSTRAGPAIATGLFAAVLIAIMGNYQVPLIEIPYETGVAAPGYLEAIDSEERLAPRAVPANSPEEWDYWWFFRAARVLNDRNLDGSRNEVIDEFPQFSFLLADVHPHVLALPFAVLALGLALNVVLSRRRPSGAETVLYGVMLGGLVFLNTWDGPIYIAVLIGADGLRRLMGNGRGRLSGADVRGMALLGAAVAGIAILAYLPFLLSFRSQLGGALPNVMHPTSFVQFFIMFGPLLLLLAAWLAVESWRARAQMNWKLGLQGALLILGVLLAVMFALTVVGYILPDVRGVALGFVEGSGGWGAVLPQLLSKRLTHIFTTLALVIGLVVVIARLFPRLPRGSAFAHDDERRVVRYSASAGFALLLVGAGLMLTLTPEYVYLRDNFGMRMNTVFKFYYQAWVLWGIAAAFGAYAVLGGAADRTSTPLRAAYSTFAVFVVGLGLIYPVLGVHYRTQIETGRAAGFNAEPLTLDGGPDSATPSDYQATLCLGQLVQGDDVTVASAVGGSYDVRNPATGLSGRLVGLPNLLNWPGHQSQWRGATYSAVAGTREQDIDQLYSDSGWPAVQAIIARYGIDFIFFGEAERAKYGSESETRLLQWLPIACESGSSRYFRADLPPASITTPVG